MTILCPCSIKLYSEWTDLALVWVNNVSALKDFSSTRELYVGHWTPTVERHSLCKGNFYASEMTFQVVNQGWYMYLKMEKYYTKSSTRICQRVY